jgi:hypothetical protein
MRRSLTLIASLAAIAGAAGAMSCSSSSAPAAPAGCQSANVSFSADVMPVFQRGCTLASVCHGQMNSAVSEDLYLGLNVGGGGSADAKAVYNGLVGVPSKEDPSMPIVTKGDNSTSYLFQKLNLASLAALASACSKATMMCTDCTSDAPCGGQMPYEGDALDSEDACTLQNWISEGAPNN